MFSSATQQNYSFISPCDFFRMSEDCLFPLKGLGEGGREVERGIRREGESVTLETAPKEGVRGIRCRGSVVPLCHVVLPYSGVSNLVPWAFSVPTLVLVVM